MHRVAESTLVAEELPGGDFHRMRSEWDELASRSGARGPFHRHYFLRTWIENFAPTTRLRLFAAREGKRLVGALPLLDERTRMYGIPLRGLRAPANVHSCRFDLLCDSERPQALRALWAQVKGAGFDVITFPDVPQGGAAYGLVALAEADGFPVFRWNAARSPYVPLQGGLDALTARLDSHFRANLRRRRKRLQEKGNVELQKVTGGPELERHLEEALRVEQAGWKWLSGTAIAEDPSTRGFYCELARRAALENELALWLLRLDGKVIAFQYGLVSGDAYYLPKTSYDESLRECSPGQLLTEDVLRSCSEQGLREFDFLGPSMSWKLEWTDALRAHQWLFVFGRGGLAKLAWKLKADWLPRLREATGWKR